MSVTSTIIINGVGVTPVTSTVVATLAATSVPPELSPLHSTTPTPAPRLGDPSTLPLSFRPSSSSEQDQSVALNYTFATLSSAPTHMLTSKVPTFSSVGGEKTENGHTPARSSETTLVVLLLVVGILFVACILIVGIFRKWKDLHRIRYLESEWTTPSSQRIKPRSYKAMALVPEEGGEIQTCAFNEFDLSPSPASRVVHLANRNPLQSYLNYRRGCLTDFLEEVDEESDSMVEIIHEKKTTKPAITPGLGPARYRAKSCKTTPISAQNPFLGDPDINRGTNRSPSGRDTSSREIYSIPKTGSPELKRQKRNDILYPVEKPQDVGDTSRGFGEFGLNQSREGGNVRSSGASYLLIKLKESISSRSKLSSIRSSDSRVKPETIRQKWKGHVDKWEALDEVDNTSGSENSSDSKCTEMAENLNTTPTKYTSSRKREFSLVEIPLPEVAALPWNVISTSPSEYVPSASYQIQLNNLGGADPKYDQVSTPTRSKYHTRRLSSQVISPSSFSLLSSSPGAGTPMKSGSGPKYSSLKD